MFLKVPILTKTVFRRKKIPNVSPRFAREIKILILSEFGGGLKIFACGVTGDAFNIIARSAYYVPLAHQEPASVRPPAPAAAARRRPAKSANVQKMDRLKRI